LAAAVNKHPDHRNSKISEERKMKKKSLIIATCVALVLGLAMAGSAWAGPDSATLTPTSATVNSTSVDLDVNGQNYYLPADLTAHPVTHGTVNGGNTIVVNFTVGATAASPSSTTYTDEILHLTASTLSPVGANVTVDPMSDCTFTSVSNTFQRSATITAPEAQANAVAYQVKILANDGKTGNNRLKDASFLVNFTVAASSGCTAEATSLILNKPDCVLLHATSLSLSATLTVTSPVAPLANKDIDFLVDGNKVGTATTDSNGVATLDYNPSALTVGDHTLSAAWTSDSPCLLNPNVTGATLGVQYLFKGFQPPINADGNTCLTGKCGPVKIIILDANGVVVSDATPYVYFTNGIPLVIGTDTANVATGLNFDYGNLMRYSDGQYVYNWDLSNVGNGTKTILVDLGEGSCAPARTVVVSVGKKGK
jgi:hypothetical protein